MFESGLSNPNLEELQRAGSTESLFAVNLRSTFPCLGSTAGCGLQKYQEPQKLTWRANWEIPVSGYRVQTNLQCPRPQQQGGKLIVLPPHCPRRRTTFRRQRISHMRMIASNGLMMIKLQSVPLHELGRDLTTESFQWPE